MPVPKVMQRPAGWQAFHCSRGNWTGGVGLAVAVIPLDGVTDVVAVGVAVTVGEEVGVGERVAAVAL